MFPALAQTTRDSSGARIVENQTVVRCPVRARHERTLIWLGPTRVVTVWEGWYVLFERVGE